MTAYFSLVDSPPPGFIFTTPSKRELLTGHIALFVDELSDAFTLLSGFRERVQGLIITVGPSFNHKELTTQLWHLTLPGEQLHLLQQFADCTLNILERAHQEIQKNAVAIADMKYNSQMHSQAQDGYNRALIRLQLMMEKAHLESEKRERAIIQLKREIRARKKAQKEQLRLETELHRAQKMEAIGLMAGGVAHDLNNILAGVVGYPDLLLMNLPENSPLRQPLKNIKTSGKRAAEVVADLLAIARTSTNLNTVANLNTILHQYLDSLEFKKLQTRYPNISFRLNLDEDLDNICCSISHIKKCLMNLITNSSEAITGPGTIEISTENRHIGQDTKYGDQIIKKGNYTTIRIKDSGQGMTKEDLSHIFEPFYSRKKFGHSGTGLGLTVVWNTVRDHRGRILVKSCDSGTIFTLFFPTTTKELPGDPIPPPHESLRGNQELIMVVDDEELLLNLAEAMLLKLNYRVITMHSGTEAVEYARHNHIDLIVLDMIMEPDISGLETFEKIIAVRPGQRAIIASGFAENEDVIKVLHMGASHFLHKPYTSTTLGKAIKEALDTGGIKK